MKKFLSLFAVIALFLSFASCDKEDEPQDYTPTYDGVSVYINVLQKLYENGEPAYTPIGNGIYAGQADSETVAYNFIANLIEDPSWGNKDLTVALGENGESGYIKIIGGSSSLLDQGIYNEIIVNVVDYTPYTLRIITSKKAENGYGEEIFIKRIEDESDSEE